MDNWPMKCCCLISLVCTGERWAVLLECWRQAVSGEISIYIVPCAVRAVSTAEVLERPGELTCVADLMS